MFDILKCWSSIVLTCFFRVIRRSLNPFYIQTYDLCRNQNMGSRDLNMVIKLKVINYKAYAFTKYITSIIVRIFWRENRPCINVSIESRPSNIWNYFNKLQYWNAIIVYFMDDPNFFFILKIKNIYMVSKICFTHAYYCIRINCSKS